MGLYCIVLYCKNTRVHTVHRISCLCPPFCFVVAMCDLVHDVEVIFHLRQLLTASGIPFRKHAYAIHCDFLWLEKMIIFR